MFQPDGQQERLKKNERLSGLEGINRDKSPTFLRLVITSVLGVCL